MGERNMGGQFTDRLDNEPLRIAPKAGGGTWTVEDWNPIKNFATEDDWQKAITIFECRIRGRYLNIVEAIERYEFAGFAVMALDCLLIETLQQFYDGVRRTKGTIRSAFCRFLTQSSFKSYFDRESAAKFYEYIRNGILHQAEIKGSSRIWIRKDTPLVRDAPDGNGLIINRHLFHQQLMYEFQDYVSRLRKCDPSDDELRHNFRAKMDAICNAETEKVEWKPCE
jgi:hypothetical protein